MTDIVKGRSTLSLDVCGIARFGETEEVFTRCDGMGPGVAAFHREVVGHALGHADQHAVVLRGARVLVCGDRYETIVRASADWSCWVHLTPGLEAEQAV